MVPDPWNEDRREKQDVLTLALRLVGLVLCIVGLWQLAQGFLAAQNPAIAPAASWAVPAILGGIPIGVACLVVARIRRARAHRAD